MQARVMLQAGMTAGQKMHRLHKSIILVIVELRFVLACLSPLLYFVRFCSTAHCREQLTRVAQAVVTEEQSAYQQHSAWGCSQHHL